MTYRSIKWIMTAAALAYPLLACFVPALSFLRMGPVPLVYAVFLAATVAVWRRGRKATASPDGETPKTYLPKWGSFCGYWGR